MSERDDHPHDSPLQRRMVEELASIGKTLGKLNHTMSLLASVTRDLHDVQMRTITELNYFRTERERLLRQAELLAVMKSELPQP